MIGLPTHFLVHAGNGGLIHPLPLGPGWTSSSSVPSLLTQPSSPGPVRFLGFSNEFFKRVEKAQLVAEMKAGVLGLPSPLGRASGRKGALGADR